jgi:hypothetical protein
MWGKKQKQIDNLRLDINHMCIQLQLALLLAEGCQKHPSYRGVRKPTSDCNVCKEVKDYRTLLNKDGLAIRKGGRGPNKEKD